ncbi:ADP-ribosylglycohydrolase family protein [Flavobacterium sp. RSSB_23]|uniref:ADP-ribosylglycohydrolase family protein n=1 Tax=Flavobacterium sp. RSSB_23 TaxID=3447668 RepID=UPI003F3DDEE5
MKNLNDLLKDILFGVAVGDALGVPVEFKDRAYLKKSPITDMIGYGTHDQPKGTWSDDSSLTFCLAENIIEGLDLQKLANKFISWKDDNYWTPHGWVFDIGIATRIAIEKLAMGEKPELAGGIGENDNGNGSLMRILPLLIHIKDKPIKERFAITKQVSSLTHAHIRSVIACFYYLEFSRRIAQGQNKFEIYKALKNEISDFLIKNEINPIEIELFESLLKDDIFNLEESEINSSGYVLHTLEASIWCLLKTNTYQEAVLKAVNLGKDTDTTGAVTGGISALLYGYDAIPKDWINCLAKKNEIYKLC